MENFKKFTAEFIGTCVLVFFGCGTAVAVGCSSEAGSGYVLTALAFGAALTAMAYSIGNVSGCHINPAVSLAMLITKKIDVKQFFVYIAAQFTGALAGAGILRVFAPKDSSLGSNFLYNDSVWLSILIEAILTFVFVLAVLGAVSKKENAPISGLIIGLSLTLVHIFGIHFTGTSVNPARSLGPAVWAMGDSVKNVWVFILAPTVGAVAAALIFKFLSVESKPKKTIVHHSKRK